MKRRTVLAGGAGLALVGLGSARAAAPDPVSGKLSIWLGYGETAPTYRLAMPAFKEMYPNIQIEMLSFDLHEYEAKLAVAVPTGNGPDLLTLHDYIFPHYYESDSLDAMPADLAAVVNNPEDRRPGLHQDRLARRQAVGHALVEGRPGAVLQPRSFQGSRPVRPAQDDERDVGIREKLTKKAPDGTLTRAGITLRLTEGSGGLQKFSDMYYVTTGVQMLEPGPKPGTVRVTLKDNLDAAAQLLLDYIEHLHGPKKVDDWALKHDAQGFANGAASMLMREDWVVAFVRKNGPDIHFATAPVPRDKAWGNFNFIEILSVNKDSEAEEAGLGPDPPVAGTEIPRQRAAGERLGAAAHGPRLLRLPRQEPGVQGLPRADSKATCRGSRRPTPPMWK